MQLCALLFLASVVCPAGPRPPRRLAMDDPTGVGQRNILCVASTSYFFTARRWFPHVFIDHTKLPCCIVSACCGCACRLEINNFAGFTTEPFVQESGFMKRVGRWTGKM